MNVAWLLLWAAAISTSAVNAQADAVRSSSINGSAQDNGPFAFATMAGKHSPANSDLCPGELSNRVSHNACAELVLPEGYPLEEHTVETKDGYLLSVYRMRAGRLPDHKLQHAE